MFAGFRSQGYHIIDHGSNILYLGINISCHFLRGGCPGLQLAVMVGQFVHSVYDNVRTMFVFRGKFADNGDSIHDGIAGGFNLFNSCNNPF